MAIAPSSLILLPPKSSEVKWTTLVESTSRITPSSPKLFLKRFSSFKLLKFAPRANIFIPVDEIKQLRGAASKDKINPRDIKLRLASELVERFHGKKKSLNAHDNFINRFQKKEITDDILEINIDNIPLKEDVDIINLLTKKTKIITSTSEVRRLIKQNAIKIDNETITSIDYISLKSKQFVLKVGKKKIYKI